MTSLRRRLLQSLWLTLAVVGLSAAVITYFASRAESNSLLDDQMQHIAALIGAQSIPTQPEAANGAGRGEDHEIEDTFLVSIRDAGGRLLYASRPEIVTLPLDGLGFRTVNLGQQDYRIFIAQSGARRIAVAQQLEVRREADALAAIEALAPVLLLVPVLGLVISLVIRNQLRPLSSMAQLVAQRAPLALDPLPVTALPAEILPLIEAINRLLGRLRQANELEQRFIADAAHALRTPLTALQLQADVLEGSADPARRAVRLAELRGGVRRTVRLANHLLALAGNQNADQATASLIMLDQAVTEVCEVYAPIAASRGVTLQVDAKSRVSVTGSMRQITQLVGNLLDNALRYSPEKASIVVAVRCEANNAEIEITDAGPGLPPCELEKVFDRFYRAPGDSTEGGGLGLAVVREVARQLGGDVQLRNRASGSHSSASGLIARVSLPNAAGISSNAGAGKTS